MTEQRNRQGPPGAEDVPCLEEYFRRVEALIAQLETKAIRLCNEIYRAEDEDDLDRAILLIDQASQTRFELTRAIAQITPPPQVREAHDEVLASSAELEKLWFDLRSSAQSSAEWQEAVDDPIMDDASSRCWQALSRLQDIAHTHGIDLHLGLGIGTEGWRPPLQ
jgi:hypothetical protein